MSLLYSSQYFDGVFSSQATGCPSLTIVAGAHSRNFPYYGDAPWDNVLLSIDGQHYQQTVRQPGLVRFNVDLTVEKGTTVSIVIIDGPLVSVHSGEEVPARVELRFIARSQTVRQEGKRYNLFDFAWVPGLRWHPFSIDSGEATVALNGKQSFFPTVTGAIEHGLQSNFRADRFAFFYDYLAVVSAGEAYTYVSYRTRPCGTGLFANILDWYMARFASTNVTFREGREIQGNDRQFGDPTKAEVVFENNVFLKKARLRRQLVVCRDGLGASATGLREIFELI
jgi:hypothetical protein